MMLHNKTLGSLFLITGTCIGAGMLALPISTAPAGFYTAGALIVGMWLMMLITAFLVLEANLWFKDNTSFISMAALTLGKKGKHLTWLGFILLLYALMAAYITGGGALIQDLIAQHTAFHLNTISSALPWVVVLGAVIYLGTVATDILNKIFTLGLIICYLLLVVFLLPHGHWRAQAYPHHSAYTFAALPILITAYGYHIIIPSISQHLGYQVKKIHRSILLGSLIALFLYLLWQFLIFATLPTHGPMGIHAIFQSGQPAATLTQALAQSTPQHGVGTSCALFAFFALASSFIGVALGLFHLLCDGIRIKNQAINRTLSTALTFLPPLAFALMYPKGFILALSWAGVLVALLHGLLPALMVWSGRYRQHRDSSLYQVPGGKPCLLIIAMLSLLIIAACFAVHLHWLPKL
jgi:tyrosine-specific transport protein